MKRVPYTAGVVPARRCARLATAFVAAIACLLLCGPAQAGTGLFVGLNDDGLKATPTQTASAARDIGLRSFAISLAWRPGESSLSDSAAAALNTAVVAAGGSRLVVAIYGDYPPETPDARDQYCSYARDILARHPIVRDIVVWNEPNLSSFWPNQFTPSGESRAPALYEALLESCYDVLHAARADVNVIGFATSPWGNDNPFATSNVSHSPTHFILEVGRAYRAGGRRKPILDTLAHHPYPSSSTERPWFRHTSEEVISIGDIDRLTGAVQQAFAGTAQPPVGPALPIWYLESGYQTIPDPAKNGLYFGTENWPGQLSADVGGEPEQPPPAVESAAPDQGTQLVDSIRLAYCQPHVQAIFNFLLQDEPDLGAWQSGVLWADGTRKGSYAALRRVVGEVNSRSVDCTRLKGVAQQAPASGARSAGDTSRASIGTRSGSRSVDRRTKSVMVWTGRNPTPFGYERLAVRLRAGSRPLVRKYVSFAIGRSVVVTRTDRNGRAVVKIPSPLMPGAHLVEASFAGGATHQPAAVTVLLRVVNSPGAVVTRSGKERSRGRAHIKVRSDGGSVRGSLVAHLGSRTIAVRRLSALGVAPQSGSAWLAGRALDGSRVVANVVVAKNVSVVRLWVGGTQLPSIALRADITRRSEEDQPPGKP